MLTFLLASLISLLPSRLTVDRSYSVKMLEHLAENTSGRMSREEVGQLYVSDFVQHGWRGPSTGGTAVSDRYRVRTRRSKYVAHPVNKAMALSDRLSCITCGHVACQHSSQ